MASAECSNAIFDVLPEDALANILSRLQPADLAIIECTSSRFRRLVISNGLWRQQLCDMCANFAEAVATVDTKKCQPSAGAISTEAEPEAAAAQEAHLQSRFHKGLCREMLLTPGETIGEDTVIVREGSENRMMDGSVNDFKMPHIRQLFLHDPELLILKLRHATTLVDKIIIGSTYQRSLESISQQIRFHFGLKSCELPLIFDSQTSNEGTWCTRTLTIDHAKAALPQGQEFDIKVLSIGRLLKIELLDDDEAVSSGPKAGMYNITVIGKPLSKLRSTSL
ncbi:TPA: hypothetical protein ACH3X3_004164 [Trebouxia sp. C0006]